jgi:serine/threonine protein kinase
MDPHASQYPADGNGHQPVANNPAAAGARPPSQPYNGGGAAPMDGDDMEDGPDEPLEKPLVIAGKYKLGEQLGSGSFGAIFFASHIHSGQHVAVKLETSKAHKQRRSQLEIEYRLYRVLQGHVGIPRIYWFGRESGCRALVMELLGPSLEDMFKTCKRLFSVKTVRHERAE